MVRSKVFINYIKNELIIDLVTTIPLVISILLQNKIDKNYINVLFLLKLKSIL